MARNGGDDDRVPGVTGPRNRARTVDRKPDLARAASSASRLRDPRGARLGDVEIVHVGERDQTLESQAERSRAPSRTPTSAPQVRACRPGFRHLAIRSGASPALLPQAESAKCRLESRPNAAMRARPG